MATKQKQELDEKTPYTDLVEHTPKINQQLARYGVKFGIYKDGTFNERLFPFDAIPRVIEANTWKSLEAGLIQRVRALNLYLADVYGNRQIIADGVVPEDFAFASSGYLPPNARESPRPAASTATSPASIWSKDRTARGMCSRTTCASPRARATP